MKSMLLVQVIARAAAYDATWASLDGRPAPSWFADAKFGIKMHWAMYSVPSWNDLDPRQDAARRADATSRRRDLAPPRRRRDPHVPAGRSVLALPPGRAGLP